MDKKKKRLVSILKTRNYLNIFLFTANKKKAINKNSILNF